MTEMMRNHAEMKWSRISKRQNCSKYPRAQHTTRRSSLQSGGQRHESTGYAEIPMTESDPPENRNQRAMKRRKTDSAEGKISRSRGKVWESFLLVHSHGYIHMHGISSKLKTCRNLFRMGFLNHHQPPRRLRSLHCQRRFRFQKIN